MELSGIQNESQNHGLDPDTPALKTAEGVGPSVAERK
jgi:hypothetical protein